MGHAKLPAGKLHATKLTARHSPRCRWYHLKKTANHSPSPLLLQILNHLNLDTPTDHLIWASCLVRFIALLKKSNVLASSMQFDTDKHLRRQDIVFHNWGMMLQIRWSKTIQFKDRVLSKPIPRCPNRDYLDINPTKFCNNQYTKCSM